MKRIGIALGAGGARGLAHIKILEALEELKIKPTIISGTSIGAIVGAFFAAGIPTTKIHSFINEIVYGKSSKFWEIHRKSDFVKYFDFLDPTIKSGGLLKGEKLIKYIAKKLKASDFNDLKIPLKVVATDYNHKIEVVFQKGELIPAIRSSYSLPFLFSPVKYDNELLIDGGMVNPLPYDIIRDECDITIAIDVSASNGAKEVDVLPTSYEILFSAFQIMQNSIVNEKIKLNKPDILIKTNIKDVRVHEFKKLESIFEQAQPSKEELKSKLIKILEL